MKASVTASRRLQFASRGFATPWRQPPRRSCFDRWNRSFSLHEGRYAHVGGRLRERRPDAEGDAAQQPSRLPHYPVRPGSGLRCSAAGANFLILRHITAGYRFRLSNVERGLCRENEEERPDPNRPDPGVFRSSPEVAMSAR